MRRIVIAVPSPHPTGPIKGAYALANAIAHEREVTLVTFKRGPGVDAALDPRVTERSLADIAGGWRNRLHAYRGMLRDAGGRSHVASISMCFTADIVNCFSAESAVTCASLRGNIFRNYRLDYGFPGVPLAFAHLSALRKVDHIVAITSAMASQVKARTGKTATVIGNFVDEAALDAYRSPKPPTGAYRVVFLGTLSERKQPLLVVRAVHALRQSGVDVVLDMIGTGPLAGAVIAEVDRLRLQHAVVLHGHMSVPYPILAGADVMVLPSLSEGLARSSLEALHLGVPCVLRAIDGNAELITRSEQGALFLRDPSLAETILSVAQQSRARRGERTTLLPPFVRQSEQARRYVALVEETL